VAGAAETELGTRTMKDMAALALGVGLLATGLGLLWPWIERLGLDRLGFGHVPGDIMIDRGDVHFRLPLGTSAVIAAIVAVPLLLWKHGLS
jgi:Protein of unknown function (DUF2905)